MCYTGIPGSSTERSFFVSGRLQRVYVRVQNGIVEVEAGANWTGVSGYVCSCFSKIFGVPGLTLFFILLCQRLEHGCSSCCSSCYIHSARPLHVPVRP